MPTAETPEDPVGKSVEGKSSAAILLFLLLTAVFSSAFYYPMIRSSSGGPSPYVAGFMWCPAFAALLTVAILKLDWKSLGLGWGTGSWANLSIAIPFAYAALAYILIWIIGLGSFPAAAEIAAISEKLGWTITDPVLFLPLYFIFLLVTALAAGVARALGEEIGWRGLLTPLLVGKWGLLGGSIATGLIWTAWHVPLILFGEYNSGAPIWFSILCFTVMVLAISVIMTILRLRFDSVWPCAFLHACHNLFIQRFFTPLTEPAGPATGYAIDEFGFAVPLMALIFAGFLWRYHVKATNEPSSLKVAAESR